MTSRRDDGDSPLPAALAWLLNKVAEALDDGREVDGNRPGREIRILAEQPEWPKSHDGQWYGRGADSYCIQRLAPLFIPVAPNTAPPLHSRT